MWEIGTTRRIESDSPTASLGMRALSPLPSPLRRAIAHLLSQLAVRHGASRGRIENRDGLPERRGLREAHRPGDHNPADALREVLPYLVGHVDGETGPSVVHGEHDGGDFE